MASCRWQAVGEAVGEAVATVGAHLVSVRVASKLQGPERASGVLLLCRNYPILLCTVAVFVVLLFS